MARRSKKSPSAKPEATTPPEAPAPIEAETDREIDLAIVGPDPLADTEAVDLDTSPIVLTNAQSERLDEAAAAAMARRPDDLTPLVVDEQLDGANDRGSAARRRRLARAGFDTDRCPMLGVELDASPRSATSAIPAVLDDGTVVSLVAASLVRGRITPEQLEHAAAWLRAREEGEGG